MGSSVQATEVGAAPSANESPLGAHGAPSRFWPLAIGSIGVVFGDIGTSPLYAFRLALAQASHRHMARGDIIGVVSLALWALILVVTIKYVLFLMRADNRGEGGVLSLMALAERAVGRRTGLIFLLGVFGAALFYGDAAITPAISVLSAVEGLRSVSGLGTHIHQAQVLMISIGLLFGLFAVQSRGTARVGVVFGPIMALWFLVIAVVGLLSIARDPAVLLAFSPYEAAVFLFHHGMVGFLVLGAIFLTVTGAEALFADMGHFGRWPIQASWLFFALPCLMLNYLGQGAFALQALGAAHGGPIGDQDWFFQMTPVFLRLPMVLMATAATIIASQAVITGAFSLTQQAIQLGLLPRLITRNTSESHAGQIYLPSINLLLMLGVLFLVAAFKTSESLGNAYGLAVTGTMVVTTSLAFIVVRRLWKWPLWGATAFVAPLLAVDLTFLTANGLKIPSGGWLPLTIAGALVLLMVTWVRGSKLLWEKVHEGSIPLTEVAPMLVGPNIYRSPGTAVFMTSDPTAAPVALLHNLKHNKVLHERNVILTVRTAPTPRVPDAERLSVQVVDPTFTVVVARYGFMERPNVPRALTLAAKQGLRFDLMTTSFFVGRRLVAHAQNSALAMWRFRLYAFLMRNSEDPTGYFGVPPGRVVEMGAQISV
ncbi:MAG TPA: potassium transporter Kup [Caulobacteraceae bacterium]|jgi:KUP system potassium uptake protein|nr:potassium transporter Kup [Caulobacteraceae bacterium]